MEQEAEQKETSEPTIHNLSIVKSEEGIWRVFDDEKNNRGRLEVHRNDLINWRFPRSNAQIAFYKDLNEYFRFERGLFRDSVAVVLRRFEESERPLESIFLESYSQFVERGDSLQLRVKEDAPADSLVYQIYIAEEDTFVVGDSPPMLDIQDSH